MANSDDHTFVVNDWKNKSTRGSCLFNIRDVQTPPLSPSSKSKQLIYEDKLKDEIKQWTNLMRDTNKNLESTSNAQLLVKMDEMDSEQLNYVQKAPDFQKFQRESNEFCLRADYYLNRVADLRKKLRYIEHVLPIKSQMVAFSVANKLVPLPKD